MSEIQVEKTEILFFDMDGDGAVAGQTGKSEAIIFDQLLLQQTKKAVSAKRG